MTQEEKARAYNEALERAKNLQENSNGMILKKWLWKVFPELKESEDERIRKEIINYFQCQSEEEPTRKEIHNKWISWLEKQASYTTIVETGNGGINALVTRELPTDGCDDEQKPADKVEPKFKIGDWVIDEDNNCVYQIKAVIENVTSGKFSYDLMEGGYFPSTKKNYHLWAIQDAKDGDVLADNDGVILFRKIGNERYADVVDYYCVVDTSGRFEIQEKFDYWGEANDAELHPATKEQRDILLKAMANAGYKWDAENKELKD